MDKELENFMQEYQCVTLEILESLQKDNIELQYFFDKRQKLIDNINSIGFSSDEFAYLVNKYNILGLEEKLKSLVLEKKEQTKSEMKRLQVSRNANSNYNKKYTENFNYFNKKI